MELVQLRLLLHLDPVPDWGSVLPLGQLREVHPQQALHLTGCQVLGKKITGIGIGKDPSGQGSDGVSKEKFPWVVSLGQVSLRICWFLKGSSFLLSSGAKSPSWEVPSLLKSLGFSAQISGIGLSAHLWSRGSVPCHCESLS